MGMGRSAVRWTPQEQEHLSLLLGDQPFAVVVSMYRKWASTKAMPLRTPRAIKCQAYRLQQSLRPTGLWLSSSAIGEMLGKDRSTVKLWANNGWVKRRGRVMSRAGVQQLARDRPWIFGGCNRSGMVQLLEDEALVDSILEAYPSRYGRPMQVVCSTTGRRYRSARAAAKACYLDRCTVTTAIREGREAFGLRFEAA